MVYYSKINENYEYVMMCKEDKYLLKFFICFSGKKSEFANYYKETQNISESTRLLMRSSPKSARSVIN